MKRSLAIVGIFVVLGLYVYAIRAGVGVQAPAMETAFPPPTPPTPPAETFSRVGVGSLVVVPVEFSIQVVHAGGCGRIAFYRRPGPLAARLARMPDGSTPAPGTVVRCGSCGRPVDLRDLQHEPRFR